ncbi:polysaccharide deacetylase family protein [Lentibacillus sp. Marseille-P4043]|uniref:polysaccharide deacetylase family protein n=1 Tax=Lentibacillus sp. Marseille-P4043 TaxID=2040293 RepID=UPI000D0BA02B|nr:polysaccharide deacetylase family protein [Lentibacillus sp. Marseille-P4043]
MYRNRIIHFCVFIIIVAISFNNEYNPFIMNDTQMFSNSVAHVSKQEDKLYKEIQAKSDTFSIAPQDATIDKVWKKTPGRNGVKVNVKKSYQQMKKDGIFDKTLLVYDQVSPEVSLADLPPSPIYRGHPEKQMTAFLINVSWGTEYIPTMLNVLKEKNVKATFFIEGKWAKENSEFVEMIDEQGHVIGNHAYNHPDMAHLSNQEMTEQVKQTNEIIKAITGKTPKWFAPPSGSFNNQVVKIADNMNMQTILWTVDTIDWKNPTVSVMVNRVNSKLHPGAMVLMHPTAATAEGLGSLITTVKEKGYKIGTVDKLLSEER